MVRISLCLCNCFDSLVEVSSHRYLSNIYITIAHCDRSHIFLLGLFTASCELCDRTCRCRLGRLSACVGVNLCIEYHNVDVTSACENMVNTTESDIVSPSVTTEDPLGFLSKEVFLCKNVFCLVASASLKSCNQFLCCCTVGSTACESIQPFLTSSFNVCIVTVSYNIFNFCFQAITIAF